ncbi:MAG: cytochrome b/b6 domain-containing protein [Rhodobacterales bacterium]|nr:cytochrome b/b6 domain-containing protein [Rhodobacterales bacterium]
MPTPVPSAYSRMQIRLHWLVFGLLILQYLLHEPITEAFDLVEDGLSPAFSPLVAAHVFGGFLIFVLAAARLYIRSERGVPPFAETDPPLRRMAAQITHYSLYALLIAMPVSGAVAWFRANEAAAEAHEVMRVVLLALIALHVVAALYHQFVLKDGLMQRMRRGDSV